MVLIDFPVWMRITSFAAWLVVSGLDCWGQPPETNTATTQEATPANLQPQALVAWCIVPFDAEQRAPVERAKMLRQLGLRHLAYDWREEHVASWDDEIAALRDADIDLTAFWCPSSLQPSQDPGVQRIVEFLERNQVSPQLWVMLPTAALDAIEDADRRTQVAAAALDESARLVAELDCQVGLYNHGGWIGQPENLVRVLEACESDNVGIVYNFHHAHAELDQFPEALRAMQPHLLCLNLNGMNPGGEKIVTLGEGKLDRQMLGWILDTGYAGPVSILDHRPELDAEASLRANLEGLQLLLEAAQQP